MVVKNFIFRENWVVSEVAGVKIAFLPFWTQSRPYFGSNMEFLKHNFNFQTLSIPD